MIAISAPPNTPVTGLAAPAPSRSSGFSPEAATIEQMWRAMREAWLTSEACRQRVEQASSRLEELEREASAGGWDGHGAPGINPEALEAGRAFFELLPAAIPLPDISADSDGNVALDWDFGWRRGLAVSIAPYRRVHFAGTDGSRDFHGTDWFDDSGIPATLANAFSLLLRRA